MECVTKVGDELCTEVDRDFYPWVKTPGIHRAAAMYTLGLAAFYSPVLGYWLYGLEGQIVEVISDDLGAFVGVDLHGHSVKFETAVRILTNVGAGSSPAQVATLNPEP